MPVEARKYWISAGDPLALTRQCELAGVARSTVYAPRPVAKPDAQELALLALIDAEYTRHPFFGSRKITMYLRGMGYWINRKRIQRLMGLLGLAGMAPGPNTSRPHPRHKVYPLPAQRRDRDPAQSGVEHRHYLSPPAARICVPGGRD